MIVFGLQSTVFQNNEISLYQSFRDNKAIDKVLQGANESRSKASHYVVTYFIMLKHANKNKGNLLTACIMRHANEFRFMRSLSVTLESNSVSFHILFLTLGCAKNIINHQSYLVCFLLT